MGFSNVFVSVSILKYAFVDGMNESLSRLARAARKRKRSCDLARTRVSLDDSGQTSTGNTL